MHQDGIVTPPDNEALSEVSVKRSHHADLQYPLLITKLNFQRF